jgi:putative PIN family toxin of toxin-antitoxin system
MTKIIIDTNVIVSALIQRSYPYYILYEHVLGDKVTFCLSDALMREYVNVLNRPKFSKYNDFVYRAECVLSYLLKKAKMYQPTVRLDIIKDADDNRLLELADISRAEFLITGNTNDFTMSNYKNTTIISPRDYWELFV